MTQSQRQGLLFTAFLVVGVSSTFKVLIPESNSDIEGPLKKKILKGEKDCKCCCVSVNNVPRCMCVVSSCYHSHKAEVVT